MVNWAGVLSYERYATPFGENFSTYKDSSLGAQNLRFPGQYYDKETGLSQNWHRDYDAKIGRYMQADMLSILSESNDPQLQIYRSIPGGMLNHLYAYAESNPVMNTDFTGLITDRNGPTGYDCELIGQDPVVLVEKGIIFNTWERTCYYYCGPDDCPVDPEEFYRVKKFTSSWTVPGCPKTLTSNMMMDM